MWLGQASEPIPDYEPGEPREGGSELCVEAVGKGCRLRFDSGSSTAVRKNMAHVLVIPSGAIPTTANDMVLNAESMCGA